jgi:hypothetical protein
MMNREIIKLNFDSFSIDDNRLHLQYQKIKSPESLADNVNYNLELKQITLISNVEDVTRLIKILSKVIFKNVTLGVTKQESSAELLLDIFVY